jgi:aryl-alcohol dehydrogenase-like predicted oxidoreductase
MNAKSPSRQKDSSWRLGFLAFIAVDERNKQFDIVARMNRRDFLFVTAGACASLALARLARSARAQTTGEPMLTRKIPSSGEAIPAVGMGTWQTFDPKPVTDEALEPLEEVLRVFYETGGRVIDTSPMYGHAEEVTGTLADRLKISDKLFLATKVWTQGKDKGVEQMEQSLWRLKRDKLDLMQVHNLVDWQTQLATLRQWKSQGRFRYIGVTHYDVKRFDELEKILRNEKVDFIQLPYSLAMREVEKRLLPAAREAGTAVLVMRPLEGGNLFARTRGQPLPDFVKPWASSWAEAFLKFILANEAVTCVLPATSKVEHLRDNMRAGFGRLPDTDERTKLIAELGV